MSEDQIAQFMEKMKKAESEFVTNTLEEYAAKSKSEDTQVRFMAVVKLRNMRNPAAIPILIDQLNDPSDRVRALAAVALWDYEAEQARESLIDHLQNDDSFKVRANCALALGAIGGANEELIRAIDDPDWSVKVFAINALRSGDTQKSAEEIKRLLDDPYWRVRYHACRVLMELGISNGKVIETLEGLREVPEAIDAQEKLEAIGVILKFHLQQANELLEMVNKGASPAEITNTLREKYGDPSPDQLGDLIARARELCKESKD